MLFVNLKNFRKTKDTRLSDFPVSPAIWKCEKMNMQLKNSYVLSTVYSIHGLSRRVNTFFRVFALFLVFPLSCVVLPIRTDLDRKEVSVVGVTLSLRSPLISDSLEP